MLFNTVEYFVFVPLVFAVYWNVRGRWRTAVVLAASYVFYGWWDWRFLSLIVVSTVTDYNVGRALYRTDDPRLRKWLLGLSLGVNLGLLGIFKYLGFFVASAADALERLGLGASTPVLQIALPVGISFYSFQTLSYTFDIYRRRIEPTDSLLTFGAFVAFFPQLVAGPIERARNLLPQFETDRPPPSVDQLMTGSGLIILGLFQKVAIADAVAPIANAGFDSPEGFASLSLSVSVLAFSLQIYGDFAGYSNIARGSARLFGIELMHNFREPYLSRNVTEFWRRWHISLSTWLRDYLYIPLGGNRQGQLMTYRNLLLTMLLGGLWHGASWNFVIWGGIHGLLLSAHRLVSDGRKHAADTDWVRIGDLPRVLVTFVGVSLVWIFFRAQTTSAAWGILSGIVRLQAGAQHSIDDFAVVLYAMVAMVVVDLGLRLRATQRFNVVEQARLSGALAGVGVTAIIVFSGGTQVPFIYFQF